MLEFRDVALENCFTLCICKLYFLGDGDLPFLFILVLTKQIHNHVDCSRLSWTRFSYHQDFMIRFWTKNVLCIHEQASIVGIQVCLFACVDSWDWNILEIWIQLRELLWIGNKGPWGNNLTMAFLHQDTKRERAFKFKYKKKKF